MEAVETMGSSKSITNLVTYYVLCNGGKIIENRNKKCPSKSEYRFFYYPYDGGQDPYSVFCNIEKITKVNYQQTNKGEYLRSNNHPMFKKLYKRLYWEPNRKRLDKIALTRLCQYSLTHIYKNNCNHETGDIYFDYFSYGDCIIFKKALKETFGLEYNVRQAKENKFTYKLILRKKHRKLLYMTLDSLFGRWRETAKRMSDSCKEQDGDIVRPS